MPTRPPVGSAPQSTESKASVALLSVDGLLHASFREAFAKASPESVAPMEVLTPFAELKPEDLLRLDYAHVAIVFIDLGEDSERALDLTRLLVAQRPDRPVVLVGTTTDPDLLLAGVRAGASEFLGRPPSEEALGDALSRLAPRLPKAAPPPIVESRVFAVLSGKGGTGVTTVATNLAVTLAEATHRKTLLLDFDELGTAGLLLGLWPRYTFHDLVENFHRMDDELLESMVERHDSGVDLLSSPLDSAVQLVISPEEVVRVIDYVKKSYEYVVMDLGRTLGPWVDAALAEANDVLLVSTAEVTAIRNARRVLDRVERTFSGMPSGIRIVVNQYTTEGNVTVEELRDALGHAVFRTLPRDDAAAILAADTGRPVVLNKSSRYSKGLKALGADLVGAAALNGAKPSGLKGRLSSLVRRKGRAARPNAQTPRSEK